MPIPFKLVVRVLCCSDPTGDCLSLQYSLSLNEIDLIMPLVTHCDFLCLCLWNLTLRKGRCLSLALDIKRLKEIGTIKRFYSVYDVYYGLLHFIQPPVITTCGFIPEKRS